MHLIHSNNISKYILMHLIDLNYFQVRLRKHKVRERKETSESPGL